MRLVSILFASLVLVALPAAAQSFTADTSLAAKARLVTNINVEDIKAIVVAENHTIVDVDNDPDAPMVIGKSEEGLLYVLNGAACNLEGYEDCLGLSVEVRYDADDRVTPDKIAKANWDYAAVKTVRGSNESGKDTVFVIHYAILDGGQNMGNLRTILINVLDIAPKISEIVWPAE